MALLRRFAVTVMAAGVLAGCARPIIVHPVPPPEAKQEKETVRYSYDHKLAPEPGYEPRDIDALARQLSGVKPESRTGRIAVEVHVGPTRGVPRPRRSKVRGLGDHYLDTLFWGGVGAAIGSASGEAEKGAIIGAGFGHTITHGGLHGLLSPGTLTGAAAGAAFSGNRGKGALIGAAVGHLLDDVFRANRE